MSKRQGGSQRIGALRYESMAGRVEAGRALRYEKGGVRFE